MEYITVRETAEKWSLSDRMVQQFCIDGRIPGAQKFGKSWAIPMEAEKPQDPRVARRQKQQAAGPLDIIAKISCTGSFSNNDSTASASALVLQFRINGSLPSKTGRKA